MPALASLRRPSFPCKVESLSRLREQKMMSRSFPIRLSNCSSAFEWWAHFSLNDYRTRIQLTVKIHRLCNGLSGFVLSYTTTWAYFQLDLWAIELFTSYTCFINLHLVPAGLQHQRLHDACSRQRACLQMWDKSEQACQFQGFCSASAWQRLSGLFCTEVKSAHSKSVSWTNCN